MYCNKCGKTNSEHALYCYNCGEKIVPKLDSKNNVQHENINI